MGKSIASLQPRKLQRRSLVDHESLRELNWYSPSGSDVVAGNARQARTTAKMKMSHGPRIRPSTDAHKKSSEDPSGVGADIRHRSLHLLCAADCVNCATTNPAPLESISSPGSRSQASTLPGSFHEPAAATPPTIASRGPTLTT